MSDIETPEAEIPEEADGSTSASGESVDASTTDEVDETVTQASSEEATKLDERKFVVARVYSVTFDLPSPSPLLQLLEIDSPYRRVSIPIALTEAQAVATALQMLSSPRPMTHELFSEVLRSVNVDVIALRIVAVTQGVFRAELDLMSSRGQVVVDCRPSDGVVLALRQKPEAPILVEDSIFID